MGTILCIKRIISTLAAFGRDDGVRQFELAHLDDRRADRGFQRRPRSQADRKPGAVRLAGDRRDAGHPDIGRYIQQPRTALRRRAVPQLPQQIFGSSAGFMPPKIYRCPIGELKTGGAGRYGMAETPKFLPYCC